MTLYLDIILFENIIMDYIIILATGMICKASIKHIRLIIASIIGALYAVFLYNAKLQIHISNITKILVSVCMIYIAYNPKNFKSMFKNLIIFYLTTFCFGGASYYLLHTVNPSLLRSINGTLIGTYPVKIAILGGILGFFITNISFRIIKSRLSKKDILYEVEIYYRGRKTRIKVILDTGNLLKDPITNNPVLIVESKKLESIIPKEILNNIDNIFEEKFLNISEDLKTKYCIIPFSTIGKNNGMIIGFRPDYIKIYTENEELIKQRVIIGIYNNKITKNGLYSGLMGLNLLNEELRSDKNEYNSITKT